MKHREDLRPARDPQDLARALVARQRAGDAEGMALLYEPQATLHGGEGRLIVGREAIRDFYSKLISKLIAEGRKFELGQQRPAVVSGDLALTSTCLPNGSITAEVARRQRDGTWQWVIDNPGISKVGIQPVA